jgi:hypothetical protein
VEPTLDAAALARLSGAFQAGGRVSAGDLLGLVGGRLEGAAGHEVEVTPGAARVAKFEAGAEEMDAACLDAVNRGLAAGVGLDRYLLVGRVLTAASLEVRDEAGLLVDGEGTARFQVAQGDLRVEVSRSRAYELTLEGTVTLGYTCRQLAGVSTEGAALNPGDDPCPGFTAWEVGP